MTDNQKVYVAMVDKEHILSKDIRPIQHTISAVLLEEKDGFQKIAVSISGYDDTAVELWETPEVREWAHKLINKIPYLYYYIENEYYQTQQTLMLCMNDYDSVFQGERMSPIETTERGIDLDERPKHAMKIHVHQKSMRLMFAETRKHARTIGKMANAEKLVDEMSERYGIGV